MVHNYYQQPGGEDTTFAADTAHLRQHGHEVVEYTDNNLRIKKMNRLSAAIQTIWSNYTRSRLLRIIEDIKPEVVHFHNTFLLISPSAYYACQKDGVPVVQTLQNYRLFCPGATFYRNGYICENCLGKTFPWPGIRYACYRNSYSQTATVAAMLTFHRLLKTWQKRIDIYIAPTRFFRRELIEAGLPAEKIVVKPNIFQMDKYEYRGENEKRYMLFVGRLSPEKAILTLLNAWKTLKEIPLKIAGEGPLMHEVRNFVRTENMKYVEVLGRIPYEKVFELLKRAHCLIFPSEWYEAFGCVMIEAFACGVPVIASKLGAMEEIVKEGHTGLHFTPGKSEDLASKVKWALAHPEKISEMGRKAFEEYKTKYTAERNYQMLMDIYKKAIEGK